MMWELRGSERQNCNGVEKGDRLLVDCYDLETNLGLQFSVGDRYHEKMPRLR